MKKFFSMAVATWLVVWCVPLAFCLEIPGRTRYKVNDYAGVIDVSTKEYLEKFLTDFGKEHKKIEIIVTTIPSLEGMPLNAFMHEYTPKWRRAWPFEKDRRIHFVVVPADSKTVFGIGRAVQNLVTPAAADHIIKEIVLPEFRNSKYNEGVKKGIEAITRLLRQY